MLGKRGPQRGLFEADTAYGAFVGRGSVYGWLASQRGELFRDEEFAGLYALDTGRPSVPPSLLATALVLQAYDGVSDDEARQDRKSTRLNSSHANISYAVFCLKKKKIYNIPD